MYVLSIGIYPVVLWCLVVTSDGCVPESSELKLNKTVDISFSVPLKVLHWW